MTSVSYFVTPETARAIAVAAVIARELDETVVHERRKGEGYDLAHSSST